MHQLEEFIVDAAADSEFQPKKICPWSQIKCNQTYNWWIQLRVFQHETFDFTF